MNGRPASFVGLGTGIDKESSPAARVTEVDGKGVAERAIVAGAVVSIVVREERIRGGFNGFKK